MTLPRSLSEEPPSPYTLLKALLRFLIWALWELFLKRPLSSCSSKSKISHRRPHIHRLLLENFFQNCCASTTLPLCETSSEHTLWFSLWHLQETLFKALLHIPFRTSIYTLSSPPFSFLWNQLRDPSQIWASFPHYPTIGPQHPTDFPYQEPLCPLLLKDPQEIPSPLEVSALRALSLRTFFFGSIFIDPSSLQIFPSEIDRPFLRLFLRTPSIFLSEVFSFLFHIESFFTKESLPI